MRREKDLDKRFEWDMTAVMLIVLILAVLAVLLMAIGPIGHVT